MKYTLHLRQEMPFASAPALCELDDIKIICNDVSLPAHIEQSFNPHNVRAWVIGHEHGPICAIFASCEQDALDNACDANMLECLLITDPDDVTDESAHLGNASEAHDITHAWIAEVDFNAGRDISLIVALVRAGESGADTL
jgi:hypothetical protein